MKKAAIIALVLICLIFSCGCTKSYPYGKVERDSSLTGGSLTFEYDSDSHTATFGGKGEVIAFYPADEAIGREKGNRIGFKIHAPSEIKDFSKAKLSFQGTEYSGGTFMQKVYGQALDYFVLTPIVTEDEKILTVKVTWTQNSKPQIYKIKIADGTKFASEK